MIPPIPSGKNFRKIMSKLLPIAVCACLVLTGCQMFHKSPTWDKAVHTRIAVSGEDDASKQYADGLHREFKAGRIEHRVVTYQYRYSSRLRDDATAERTAVIYRDETNPKYPWWLKDQTSNRPVWLPNGSVEQQLRFYIGREVEIVDPARGYGGGDKQIVRPKMRHRQAAYIAPPDSSESDAAFRETHGTAFNPASAVDREKMHALLRTRNATASLRDF